MSHVRKRTFRYVPPMKIQISLPICAVRSESSLGALRIAKDTKCLHADNKNSDQTLQLDEGSIQKVFFLLFSY